MHVPKIKPPPRLTQLIEKLTGLLTDPRRLSIALLLIALLLITSNILFARTFGLERLFVTAAAYGLLGMIARFLRLHVRDIGFSRRSIDQGLGWSVVIAVNISAILIVFYIVAPSLFLDARYQQSIPDALYAAFVLLPLKTVLFEELAFRGVLWGALRRHHGHIVATVVSSLAFGLWHIVPTRGIGAVDVGFGNIIIQESTAIIIVIIATTIAGILFSELRRRTNSLLPAITAHWAINGTSILLAALAWR